MSEVCTQLHNYIYSLHRFTFPFDDNLIPKNGIYILFEENEFGHGGDRIVRIGTHTGNDQLRSRLRQHFLNPNKDRSIFRKNIGRCILKKNNDPYDRIWELDCTSREEKEKYLPMIDSSYQKGIEDEVSGYIQDKFSFCVVEVNDKSNRLFLESRLISTVSLCKDCRQSDNWLGKYSPKVEIKESGLWQVQELYKQPFTPDELQKFINGEYK